MSMYDASIKQMSKMLGNLDRWLEKGIAHAEAKKFDPNVLLAARLAPDQFSFVQQVQAACDSPKFGAARLSGKEPPKHPDTEKTIEELRARIKSVIAYLDGFSAADFAGADERVLTLQALGGNSIAAPDYLLEFVTPNFYFHVAHAYAILRHNGVDLGKRDYIGSLDFRQPA